MRSNDTELTGVFRYRLRSPSSPAESGLGPSDMSRSGPWSALTAPPLPWRDGVSPYSQILDIVLLLALTFPLTVSLFTVRCSFFLQTAGGLEEVFFKNLDDLIHHYKRKNQGLAMHLRHSVKRKTALLIQPSKAPEMPPQRHPQRHPEESPVQLDLLLPQDEDNDYESMSSIPTDLCSSWIHGVLKLFFVFLQMFLTLNTSKSSLTNTWRQLKTFRGWKVGTLDSYKGRRAHRVNQRQDNE